MLRQLLSFSISLIAILTISCSEPSDPALDFGKFNSIIDHNQYDSAFYPIDIKQTPNGGYLLLAKKRSQGEFSGTYILKVNKLGNFESDTNLGGNSVNPVGGLMFVDNLFYFFCMDATSRNTKLIAVDENAAIISTTEVAIPYPCASSMDEGNNFVLLGYNHADKRTVIATIRPSGSIISSKDFGVGIGGEDEVEEDVINHFFQYGRKLPFFVGQIPGGLYYFNGFYNYTFSLVFTDMVSDGPRGLVQGQHNDGGFSAALPLGGSNFAAAVFNYGDNYIMPNQAIGISSSPGLAANLGGYTLPELVPNAMLKILRLTIEDKNVVVFGGDTKSKQIGLWFYDEATNNLISSRYLGYSNPFEIGNMSPTTDGGLVICGTTYLAGRFPRICIFKLSKDDILKQAN